MRRRSGRDPRRRDRGELAGVLSEQNSSAYSPLTTYGRQSEVAAESALYTTPGISGCLSRAFIAQESEGLPAGESVVATNFDVQPGPDAGGLGVVATARGEFTVTLAADEKTPEYLQAAFIAGPLLQAEVVLMGADPDISEATFTTLTDDVANRAEH